MEYVKYFSDIALSDIAAVGGKNASLGEMFKELSPKGIRVPFGFALTVAAYEAHLERNHLRERINRHLEEIKRGGVDQLQLHAAQIRSLITSASLPEDVVEEIAAAYRRLCDAGEAPSAVAVRSSATLEDLPEASFAGQQDSFLNVRGTAALIESIKACFGSLFNDRAVSYRHDHGMEDRKVGLSVAVQQMVRSDLAASGVLFTLDTESGLPTMILINAAYGLGETIVQGAVNPDEIYVFKPTLLQGYRSILSKKIGSKELKTVYAEGRTGRTRTVSVPPSERGKPAIDDQDILQLAQWGCLIEKHYSDKRGQWTPMDIEWAKDGVTGELFVVQARPETVHVSENVSKMNVYHLNKTGRKTTVLATGRAVGSRISYGKIKVIEDPKDLGQLQKGDILVTTKTDPDWEPSMKLTAGIVTEKGGRTCHAAIVSRELGIPAVIGVDHAVAKLRGKQDVTLSCAEGDTGYIYEGKVPFSHEVIAAGQMAETRTKIMMNLANPEEAMALSLLPNDGVGLARIEFIIANHIQVHPMALLRFDQLEDGAEKEKIRELTHSYSQKTDFFVDKLSEGIAMLAAPFYPRDVIVRFSDFKTNEYARLLGGRSFEPAEENPMLGFRGASRYYHPSYRQGFGLECRAIKRVREEFGLTNVKVMVPFCRTVDEARKVLKEMAAQGIARGSNGLQVYVMAEIPSNIIEAVEFADLFDGFSIGSNDLTQLTLGIDRDSEILAPLFDERNSSVYRLIASLITAAKRKGRKVGICGQAPSDYPEFAEKLVHLGIDSISLNPDAVIKTRLLVSKVEGQHAA